MKSFKTIQALGNEERSTSVYAKFHGGTSKAVAAQYLAMLLDRSAAKGRFGNDGLRPLLPPYVVAAIDYATCRTGDAAA